VTTHVLGIRHHGPGSARGVIAALDALMPDCVLVEGPPDADDMIPMAAHAEMSPPIALLIYATDSPAKASFYPFETYSPEWQAMRWALKHGRETKFMDLAITHQLQGREPREHGDEVSDDPLGALAVAAGYEDRELWWELHVEQRKDPQGLFDGILEAMTALRENRPVRDQREAQREAAMRKIIRAAEKKHQNVAVICGAWHAPALVERPSIKEDDALLKGLPKTKVTATWVPWTRARLAAHSGYGAGVRSPGWYAHLWDARDHIAERWLTKVAQLLRKNGLDAPPASVIEAVRLAEALAALRDRAMPGLEELEEATHAVMSAGQSARMAVIRDELEVGQHLGSVPADAPMVPLAKDLAAQQKTLRLKVSPEPKALDLDLRQENDRERSRLFHRLRLLDIGWAEAGEARGLGTFKEAWILEWDPELAVSIVEASVHGNTVASAATSKAQEKASKLSDLGALTTVLEGAVLAELPQAIDALLEKVVAVGAVSADAKSVMKAILPLARTARWGDVRGTPAARVLPVIDALYARVLIGLTGACASLDDDAAAEMTQLITSTTEALRLLDRKDQLDAWYTALSDLTARDAIHGRVRGASARLLIEASRIDEPELARLARLALSPAVPPPQAAAWAEGVLGQGVAIHLAHDSLWRAIDEWMSGLAEDAFIELLPLIRRAFSSLGPAERRRVSDKLLALNKNAPRKQVRNDVDEPRAAKVRPILRTVIGLPIPEVGLP